VGLHAAARDFLDTPSYTDNLGGLAWAGVLTSRAPALAFRAHPIVGRHYHSHRRTIQKIANTTPTASITSRMTSKARASLKQVLSAPPTPAAAPGSSPRCLLPRSSRWLWRAPSPSRPRRRSPWVEKPQRGLQLAVGPCRACSDLLHRPLYTMLVHSGFPTCKEEAPRPGASSQLLLQCFCAPSYEAQHFLDLQRALPAGIGC
jgi:hypothetical protein